MRQPNFAHTERTVQSDCVVHASMIELRNANA
jgi:hypothetical protein